MAATAPLARFLDGLERLLNIVAKAVIVVSASTIFLVLLVSIVLRFLSVGQVVSTNLSELPSLILPWLILGGVVVAAQHGAHLSISFITARLSGVWETLAVVLRMLITFYVYGKLALNIAEVMPIVADEHSAILGVSTAVTYVGVMAGFVMLLVTEAIHFLRYLSYQVRFPSSLGGEEA